MPGRSVLVRSDALLGYRFGPDHPFNPMRLAMTFDLIDAMEINAGSVLAPRPATRAELETAHWTLYIDAVRRLSEPGQDSWGAEKFGLGTDDNPIFPGMHDAASLAVGGTVVAAEQLLEGTALHALNLAGGLHHAQFGHASGFCVYNDVVVAIRQIRALRGWRVFYLDLDAHHGDGVQAAFYCDPEVLTVSFHETGRYLFPGTGALEEMGEGAGRGYAVNVPLEPYTGDVSWLECLNQLVPPLLRQFQPDVLVTQFGCDGHAWDPLTDLHATTAFYVQSARLAHEWAHAYAGGRWLATGGGGYDIHRVVPRAWAALWAEMAGRPVSEQTPVPKVWRERWQHSAALPLPTGFYDGADDIATIARAGEIQTGNRATVQRLMRLAPLLTAGERGV